MESVTGGKNIVSKQSKAVKQKLFGTFHLRSLPETAPTVSRAKAVARTLLDALEALHCIQNNCVCASVCGSGAIAEHPHSFPTSSSTQRGPSHGDFSGDQNRLARHLKLRGLRSRGHEIPHDVCVCETSDLSLSRALFSWRVSMTGSRWEDDGL